MLKPKRNYKAGSRQAGFTLLESLVAMAVLLAVGAIILYGTIQMTNTQSTISNRTEMHTSVRSATELLQQEIGQAGQLAPPLNSTGTQWAQMTLTTAVTALNLNVPFSVGISPSTAARGLYDGEYLVVDTGLDASGAPKQETVKITCTNPCTSPVTATFTNQHSIGAPISVQGSFAAGIVPPTSVTGVGNGSTDTVLKLFGDVNGDGKMVYVEYTCAPTNNSNAPGFLYRNQIAWDAATKPALSSDMIMLNNLLSNPNDQNGNPFPCFQYQTQTIGTCPGAFPTCRAYVTDVEVTLTEQTEYKDPTSKQFQKETKALLNVSPRNVFNAWELDSAGQLVRVQPTPPTITALLQ